MIRTNILGQLLQQTPEKAAAMAQRAQALQADATFWEPGEEIDKHTHLPLWHVICAFKGLNPAHWALSSPDQARTMQRHTTGDVSERLKEIVRLHDKAAGHAQAGGLKGFGDTAKSFKTTLQDLIEWAEKVGEGTSAAAKQATPETPGNEPDTKPLQRSKAQDAAILKTLRGMGYDPLQLPKNPDGKPGVKAAVRKTLKDNPLFAGTTVFEGAWERLSKFGDIVIAKVSL